MNEAWSVILTAIATGVLTGFINVAIVSRARGKFEGAVEQRFVANEGRIDGLEQSRGEQWQKINRQGERIAFVEAKVNGKGH